LRCFRFNLSLEKFLGMHVVISPVRRAVSVAYLLSSSKQLLLRRAYIFIGRGRIAALFTCW
jgi:hypothetical protein